MAEDRGSEQAGPPERAAGLRASDEDRDRLIARLNEHAGEGRLTLAELEERVERAWGARTQGELTELTTDLPDAGEPTTRRPEPARWDIAVMGGNSRRGRFRLRDRFNAVAIMGGSDIDLRQAEVDGDEVTILAVSVMGGSTIYVPDTVEVEVNGFALMGGDDEKGSTRPPRAGAPVIRIESYALMGGIDVWRLPPETRDMSLRQARRAAKALERDRRGTRRRRQ